MNVSAIQIIIVLCTIVGVALHIFCKKSVKKKEDKKLIALDPMKLKSEIRKKERLLANESPSHVVHGLFTLFTGGLWAFIWILVTVLSSSERKKLHSQIESLENELLIKKEEGA